MGVVHRDPALLAVPSLNRRNLARPTSWLAFSKT